MASSVFVGTAAGSDTQIQYNNAGAFGGTSGLTFDGTKLVAPTVQPSTSYKSTDGTAGKATASITTAGLVGKTITVKDGLITDFA